jgi:predicted nucleic acid-binding protein
VLPVQTLGELFRVLVRKTKRRPVRTRAAVLSWRDAYPVVETSAAVMINATDLASNHGLTIWDSVVLAGRRKPSASCFYRRISKKGLRDAASP